MSTWRTQVRGLRAHRRRASSNNDSEVSDDPSYSGDHIQSTAASDYDSDSYPDSDSDSNSDFDADFDDFMPRANTRFSSERQLRKDYRPRWIINLADLGMELEYVIKHINPNDFRGYSRIADLGPESHLEAYHRRFQGHNVHETVESDMEHVCRITRKFKAIRRRVPGLMKALLFPVIDETIVRLESFKLCLLAKNPQATAGAQDAELCFGGPTSLKIEAEEAPRNDETGEGTAGGIHLAGMVAEDR